MGKTNFKVVIELKNRYFMSFNNKKPHTIHF